MRMLVVGGGGREHALCWALAASPLVSEVVCAPGNAGIAAVARCVPVRADDLDGIVALALAEAAGLVVVGPEVPLVLGLVDRLRAAGVKAFGPTAAAARLEGSKAFTKAFCARHAIPTAAFRSFGAGERAEALAYVTERGAPIVVKADGLAAGKGVVVAASLVEAVAAVEASEDALVVEECLEGEEASLFALCDGTTALEIGTAQDHKRAFDGDQGPNTGGMGAYSPAPLLDAAMVGRVMAEIVRPTLAGMAAEGAPFTGILYAGLMLTATGPKLIEYNVRFGDPECEVLIPRLRSDLLPALVAGLMLVPHFPLVAKDWDHAANTVPLASVKAGSAYPAHWRCHRCGHTWTAPVVQRTGRQTRCQRCVTERADGLNSLAAIHP